MIPDSGELGIQSGGRNMLRWMTAVVSDNKRYYHLTLALGAVVIALLGGLTAVTLQA
jgi:hypothetical protein